jgi:uncharacterized protein (UPF0335 family)
MPDHINIHHPDAGERRERDDILVAEMKARITVLNQHLLAVRGDLEAIFTRIERGEECELHMKNGDIYVITGALRDDQ